MTLFAILGGLIPIMYSMVLEVKLCKELHTMIGGMVTSAFLTLIIIPSVFIF